MPKIIKVGKTESSKIFIASMWKNITKKGLEYFNISFDKNVKISIKDTRNGNDKSYNLKDNTVIKGYPNTQRRSENDPDTRLTITKHNQE